MKMKLYEKAIKENAIKIILKRVLLIFEKLIIITVDINIMHKNKDLEKQNIDDIKNNKINNLLKFLFLYLAKKATQPTARIKFA